MKKAFIVLFFCLFNYITFCQLEFQESNVGRMASFVDFNGRSLMKKYDAETTGSPFFSDWKMAILNFYTGNKTLKIPVKFNLESNELYYLDSTGKEMVASEGVIKRIEFLDADTKDSNRYILKTGYPAVDKKTQNFFYQVLSEGKMELLVKQFKYISETKDSYTGIITKEFVQGGPVYYVFQNKTIQQLYLNKNSLVSFMTDKMQLIEQFVKDNKLNLKKLTEVVKAVNFYNTLL